MIRLSNKISNWVYSEIVSTEDLTQRSGKIVKFLQMAQVRTTTEIPPTNIFFKECRKLNNFNGVFEIVAGLGNSSVHRLKKTWTFVPKEYLDFLDSMRELMSTNYKKFREELHNSSSPCIPYIGYLFYIFYLFKNCF